MAQREEGAEKLSRKQAKRKADLTPKRNEEGRIRVRICSRENGLEEYKGVNFVRVVSKRYNLMIMADYLPVIGEVQGSVIFRTAKQEYERNGVEGYFMHKNNEFSLMLRSEGGEE